MPPRKSVERQLADGVDVRGPDECWPWTKATDREGYGLFGNRGTGKLIMHKAHVVAFTFANGAPPKYQVLHRCNNPPCCNPADLYDGTGKDNAADRAAAGHQRNAPALTFEQVCTIRTVHDGSIKHLRTLAVEYDMSTRAIADIIAHTTWRLDDNGALIPRRSETCKKGHLIQLPNVTRGSIRRGVPPCCLACERTFAARTRARRKGLPFDFQAESDRTYVKIMETDR